MEKVNRNDLGVVLILLHWVLGTNGGERICITGVMGTNWSNKFFLMQGTYY